MLYGEIIAVYCGQCRREGEAGTNYWDPVVQKGARGLGVLHIFLSFSIVLRIIIYLLQKLTFSNQAPVTLHLRVSLSDLV
jgi:hypothetical protein